MKYYTNYYFNFIAKLFGAALYRPQSADPTKNEKLPVSVAKMIKTLVNYRIKLR